MDRELIRSIYDLIVQVQEMVAEAREQAASTLLVQVSATLGAMLTFIEPHLSRSAAGSAVDGRRSSSDGGLGTPLNAGTAQRSVAGRDGEEDRALKRVGDIARLMAERGGLVAGVRSRYPRDRPAPEEKQLPGDREDT